jgi:predicted ribosomally synthesized peptide with nif11-like leader
MKTLTEFIQRLQDDPAFEKQAHAFEHGDELIAFVKRQGYDFTLDQLMSEFEREEKVTAETGGPAPADARPSIEPLRHPEAPAGGASAASPLETGHSGSTPAPPLERLPPPEAEEEPRVGLFRGSGGRHRGFSPQRLKSLSEEDP